MKKTLLALSLLVSSTANAEFAVFGGFFVFNEEQTSMDYKGLSPLGEFGAEWRYHVDKRFSVAVGYKHQSSTAYREIGKGFNGPFVEGRLVIWK